MLLRWVWYEFIYRLKQTLGMHTLKTDDLTDLGLKKERFDFGAW